MPRARPGAKGRPGPVSRNKTVAERSCLPQRPNIRRKHPMRTFGRCAIQAVVPLGPRFERSVGERSVGGRSPRRRVPQTKSSSACPEPGTVPQPTAVPPAALQNARYRPTIEHGTAGERTAGRRPEKSHTGDVARSIPGAGFTSLGYSCNLDGLRFVDAPFHVHYIGTVHQGRPHPVPQDERHRSGIFSSRASSMRVSCPRLCSGLCPPRA
jgi:hypothetical protein